MDYREGRDMSTARRSPDDLAERFAAGRICAPSLVGMTRRLAEAHAVARGFEPTVIGMTVERVTADVQPNRIRLRVGRGDTVVDAWPG